MRGFSRQLVWGLAAVLAAVAGALAPQVGGRAAPPSAQAVEALLNRAFSSTTCVSYSGIQVVISWAGEQSETTVSRVYHRCPSQTRWEFQPTGRSPGWLVVDDGIHTWEYFSERKLVLVRPSLRLGAADDQRRWALLRRNYRFRYLGEGEVAGFPAVMIEIQPLTEGNPWRRLWIHPETGLILRAERYRWDGSLAHLSLFTELNLNVALPDHLFHLEVPPGVEVRQRAAGPTYLPVPEVERQVGMRIRVPGLVPPGYEFMGAGVTSQLKPGDTAYLQYSDGFNVLSFFQTKGSWSPPELANRRAVEIGGQTGLLGQGCGAWILTWAAEGITYTILGDLSPELMMAMARSVGRGWPTEPRGFVFAEEASCLGGGREK
ncbi:MAG: sigma-E factor regulatory protein RseB domain-containing protein [Bacillota bacterium]|nr:sigma-E factor regulatory protein RseB domain-containing protein [Bacillota bacterium]